MAYWSPSAGGAQLVSRRVNGALHVFVEDVVENVSWLLAGRCRRALLALADRHFFQKFSES